MNKPPRYRSETFGLVLLISITGLVIYGWIFYAWKIGLHREGLLYIGVLVDFCWAGVLAVSYWALARALGKPAPRWFKAVPVFVLLIFWVGLLLSSVYIRPARVPNGAWFAFRIVLDCLIVSVFIEIWTLVNWLKKSLKGGKKKP